MMTWLQLQVGLGEANPDRGEVLDLEDYYPDTVASDRVLLDAKRDKYPQYKTKGND